MQQQLPHRDPTTRSSRRHNAFQMTAASRTGTQINDTKETGVNPFKHLTPFQDLRKSEHSSAVDQQPVQEIHSDVLQNFDFDLNHYTYADVCRLFQLDSSTMLTEASMKKAKKILAKMHPDKSHLDEKFFIFFNRAFTMLNDAFQFQHPEVNKTREDMDDLYDQSIHHVIKTQVQTKDNFQEWFNHQFDKHRVENPDDRGYDEWLKSDEDIVFHTPTLQNVKDMQRSFDRHKSQIVVKNHTFEPISMEGTVSTLGCSSLMVHGSDNFSSSSIFSGGNTASMYSDLRQAYRESVMQVRPPDDHLIPTRSMHQLKNERSMHVQPLSLNESLQLLKQEALQAEQESSAMGFYYAQQSEKVLEMQKSFMSELKRLT